MAATHFYSNYPGTDLASLAAQFIAEKTGMDRLADAAVLVPTRRASIALREAFRRLAGERTVLLPRMISLADVSDELLTLLGHEALHILQAIPPAMSPVLRHYLLSAQVMRFESARGGDARIEHAMKLAEYLADLQDRCIRAGIDLSRERLQALFPRDYAEHWQQSLEFLNIVGAVWPEIEAEQGQITAAAHEVQLLAALQQAWAECPPAYPVFAVGSTASQPATAALLSTIAAMEQGYVLLPGLDPRMEQMAWDAVHESHPYFHLKNLLDRNGLQARDVQPLGSAPAHCSIWLEALCRVETMEQWRTQRIDAQRFSHLKVIGCHHAEEEARVITLLMREGLEQTDARIALITPDESLMARVAAQLEQYGLVANRLSKGTLADTQAGSLLVALMEANAAPESTRALVQLLRHPLVQLGAAEQWPGWLDMFERSARGVARHAPGQLPGMTDALRDTDAARQLQVLARAVLDLSRARLVASEWVARGAALLASIAPLPGQGQEKIAEILEQCATADLLGKLDRQGFAGLLRHALEASWRGPQLQAHPQLSMLTPVEARLQRFDRVILGNMVARLWPGLHGQSPWLNLAQQQELGLPGVAEHATLIAHDVLMHGSAGEVFLTHPNREAGSPATRSRYIERLLALAEAQQLPAAQFNAADYLRLATARFSAPFSPEGAPRAQPAERPEKLRVSMLDHLVSDPFSVYAQAILELRALDELDAEPERRDLGTIVHKALEGLARYWNDHPEGPDARMIEAMAEDALRDFAERPTVRLFWSRRLLQVLQFANARESHRRGAVLPEEPLKQVLETSHGPVLLTGKLDRLEGGIIVDHKTGEPPSEKDMREGRALQLLAYAAMLQAQGKPVDAVEYWGLPAGKRAGEVVALPWTPETAAELTEKLQALLGEFMDPTTQFLARPMGGQERFDNDYDGVSRYDEWAG